MYYFIIFIIKLKTQNIIDYYIVIDNAHNISLKLNLVGILMYIFLLIINLIFGIQQFVEIDYY